MTAPAVMPRWRVVLLCLNPDGHGAISPAYEFAADDASDAEAYACDAARDEGYRPLAVADVEQVTEEHQ